jgi:hypothetical protein
MLVLAANTILIGMVACGAPKAEGTDLSTTCPATMVSVSGVPGADGWPCDGFANGLQCRFDATAMYPTVTCICQFIAEPEPEWICDYPSGNGGADGG